MGENFSYNSFINLLHFSMLIKYQNFKNYLSKKTYIKKIVIQNTSNSQFSFFGVGAPEALVIGLVALGVLGPKGLVDATKSVSKTIRSFQPTINEIASLSTDLRTSLQKEIGITDFPQNLATNKIDQTKQNNIYKTTKSYRKQLKDTDSQLLAETSLEKNLFVKKSLSNMSNKELITEIKRRCF